LTEGEQGIEGVEAGWEAFPGWGVRAQSERGDASGVGVHAIRLFFAYLFCSEREGLSMVRGRSHALARGWLLGVGCQALALKIVALGT
jgi:hypothetical protein